MLRVACNTLVEAEVSTRRRANHDELIGLMGTASNNSTHFFSRVKALTGKITQISRRHQTIQSFSIESSSCLCIAWFYTIATIPSKKRRLSSRTWESCFASNIVQIRLVNQGLRFRFNGRCSSGSASQCTLSSAIWLIWHLFRGWILASSSPDA